MTLYELFMLFFRISSVTFGGGIVILGMVQLEQEKRKDIDPEEFSEMVSLATSMPGPIAVSISWLFGRHYRGLAGSFAALLGAVLPPFLIILFLSPLILEYSSLPRVRGFFGGVLAGTSAIIANVVFQNVRQTLAMGIWNAVPFVVVIAAIGFFHIHPLAAMFTAVLIQMLTERFMKNAAHY